mmetsp:Transcript_72850/g.144372  ORF Transcript_72850/g.144372 Transcript_72850/m.144372 type:complete len:224 (+) Transcript_72850:279-950(+)
MHIIVLPWPSRQVYSSPMSRSSRKSPMALWFTKTNNSSTMLYSHLGHFAAFAILRWKTPTPVALRNSSRPLVSTHFHEPTSTRIPWSLPDCLTGCTAHAGEAEACASTLSSASDSLPDSIRSASAAGAALSASRRQTVPTEGADRGVSESFRDQLTMLSNSMPESVRLRIRTGRKQPLSAWRLRHTDPVGRSRLVSVNSLFSRWPISASHGTVTAPQSTSLWK